MKTNLYRIAIDSERSLSEALRELDRMPAADLDPLEFKIAESAKTRIRSARERVKDLAELAASGDLS